MVQILDLYGPDLEEGALVTASFKRFRVRRALENTSPVLSALGGIYARP